MKIKNILRRAALAGLTALLPICASANDIYIGPRGPTNWQLDLRAGYNEKKDDKGNITKTITQTDVLKYWDGDKFGWFGYLNVPAFKKIDSGMAKSAGFGDITFGVGPRGTFYFDDGKAGTLHWIWYGGAVLPTGDVNAKPSLGNDRADFKTGAFFTYLTPKKKAEIDAAVDYICAGRNSKGVQGMDEIYGGIIAGGVVLDNSALELRLAGGINGKMKENGLGEWDYSFGPRAVGRATFKDRNGKKKLWHAELVADYDIWQKNMPKGFGLLTQLRVNF